MSLTVNTNQNISLMNASLIAAKLNLRFNDNNNDETAEKDEFEKVDYGGSYRKYCPITKGDWVDVNNINKQLNTFDSNKTEVFFNDISKNAVVYNPNIIDMIFGLNKSITISGYFNMRDLVVYDAKGNIKAKVQSFSSAEEYYGRGTGEDGGEDNHYYVVLDNGGNYIGKAGKLFYWGYQGASHQQAFFFFQNVRYSYEYKTLRNGWAHNEYWDIAYKTSPVTASSNHDVLKFLMDKGLVPKNVAEKIKSSKDFLSDIYILVK